jgi:hypothetical protein
MGFNRVACYQNTNLISVGASTSGVAWPSGKLVVSPNNYLFDNGEYIDMTQEGFYAIWADNGATFDGGSLIVYQSDIMMLMASLARACGYGTSDESLTIAQQISAARVRALWLRCGPTISFVEYWCQQLGITYREVHCLTGNTLATPGLDPNLDPYDDGIDVGHEMIEVLVAGQWVLVDVATNAAYKDATGAWLSTAAVFAAGVGNCVTVDLADYDIEQQNYSGNFMPNTYGNVRLRPENIKRWRAGICQIPGILSSDGNIYFYVPVGVTNTAAWVASLAPNYRVITQAAWMTMFYPG